MSARFSNIRPPNFPAGGNAVLRFIGRMALKLSGWKLEMNLPDVKKCVVIAAPHTSNWDFVFMLSTMWAMGLKFSWFGKHTLFEGPFGGFMRFCGGLPVDRRAAGGLVGATARAFAESEALAIGIAPEGTRNRNPVWKSGWHQIALTANVTVMCAFMDYRRKVVGSGPIFMPSDSYEHDLAILQNYYKTIAACNPDQFATLDDA